MLQGWRLAAAAAVYFLVAGGSAIATESTVDAVPGEYVLTINEEFAGVSLDEMSNELGVDVIKQISPESQAFLVRASMVEMQSSVIGRLGDHPAVDIIEPNYIYYRVALPNDPGLDRLWGLINDGRSGTKGVDVGVKDAWSIHTGARNIVVAVIDTGVDYTIADLAPNMWVNAAEANGQPNVDDDGNGSIDDVYGWDFAHNDNDPKDDHGHGSHVAGTIGAKGNDGHGVVGVNWDVQIMALKFIKKQGGGTLDAAIAAIDYSVRNGANVLNNSWGGGGFSQQLKDSIERANKANVLFVAAAGNHRADNDKRPTYPANYQVPNVISVAAIDSRGNKASFSCYGKKTVHIAAPGVNILSTAPGGFQSLSGTSMAAPHVSGVAALVWSKYPQTAMLKIKERLLQTAIPRASLTQYVATGVVNAYTALTGKMPPKDPNDPTNWAKYRATLSTSHPYKNKTDKEWKFTVPGAKRVAIHFSKFETEKNFDYLDIKDASGKVVSRISGKYGEIYSQPVEGDTVILHFHSDKTRNGYGFDIVGLAYQ